MHAMILFLIKRLSYGYYVTICKTKSAQFAPNSESVIKNYLILGRSKNTKHKEVKGIPLTQISIALIKKTNM